MSPEDRIFQRLPDDAFSFQLTLRVSRRHVFAAIFLLTLLIAWLPARVGSAAVPIELEPLVMEAPVHPLHLLEGASLK